MAMNEFGMKSNPGQPALALRAVDVCVQINGVLTRTVLKQRYCNDSTRNLEITYTFPLPVHGVLLDFAVSIAERRLHGQVVPRAQAEAAYESALQSGDSAFRLHQVRPGMYVASLGNVLAGDEVSVELTYAETLPWTGSSLRYRLPTTIAPRYGEPAGMQPWERPVTEVRAEYPLTLTARIEGDCMSGQISSPSHAFSATRIEQTVVITLAPGATMDRDFILEIAGTPPHPVGVSASALDAHTAMVTLLAPLAQTRADARDTVIVLDCSDSMTGDSLRLAKTGVLAALDSLKPEEGFGLLAFGSDVVAFEEAIQTADRRNVVLASRFVVEVGNLGGTELALALQRALTMRRSWPAHSLLHKRPVDVLLLTDGQAWGLDGMGKKALAQGSRIFAVGIGSAVAEDSLRELAEQSGGACEFVSPSEDMAARIAQHFIRMRQPRLERVDIAWPQSPLWEVKLARPCFAGDACTLFAAFSEPLSGPLSVTFQFEGQPAAATMVSMVPAAPLDDAIVRTAAMARLPQLPTAARTAWAVRHQLVTQETDCVLVVEGAAERKPGALPALQGVPQMLPAGWHGTSTVHHAASPALWELPAFLRRAPDAESSGYSSAPSLSAKGSRQFEPKLSARTASVSSQPRRVSRSAPRPTDLCDFLRALSVPLPMTLGALHALGLPAPIHGKLEAMLRAGDDEATVVLALYRALIEHLAAIYLDVGFIETVRTAGSARRDLVAALLPLLDEQLNPTLSFGAPRVRARASF